MIALLAILCPLTLYLSFPSTLWNFDGVACAAALELGDPFFFFHGNHLLYGFLGFLFWKGVAEPLGILRALPALQMFTSLLGALGLWGVFHLFRHLWGSSAQALGLALWVGVTTAVWVWSVEAQVYAMGFAGLAWASAVLFGPSRRWKGAWVGALHAAAILGHVVHVLWVLPAFWVWARDKQTPSPLKRAWGRQYLSVLLAGTLGLYGGIVGGIVWPRHPEGARVLQWILGSAGLTPDGGIAWHSAGWNGMWVALQTLGHSLWGAFRPAAGAFGHGEALALAFPALGLFVFLLARAGCSGGCVGSFAWIWVGVYGIFFSFWEPRMECYRMTDMIPIGILTGLGLSSLRKKGAKYTILIALIGLTGISNFLSRIYPMSQPVHNALFQETMGVARETPAEACYLTDGNHSWIYWLYFTGRHAWNINRLEPSAGEFVQKLFRESRTIPVFVSPAAAESPAAAKWIGRYDQKPLKGPWPWRQLMPTRKSSL